MITVVVGKEIEKIKGDFESYLNGLNMVGEISYSQYSELYDEGVKQIQRAYELGKSELEKENAELRAKESFVGDQNRKLCEQQQKIEVLEEKIAELKAFRQDCVKLTEDNVVMARQRAEKADQLTKAKEIIRQFLNDYPVITKELLDKLEQFIKDSEVEKCGQ